MTDTAQPLFEVLEVGERQRMAMTSEAAVMSKPVSRAMPRRGPPMPTTTSRSTRSSMSMTLFQVMVRQSIRPQTPSKWRRLSTMAARRLWAAVTACMSPVKWRLMSSAGGDLGMSAARGPPFKPEDRAERRLSDGSDGLFRDGRRRRPGRWLSSSSPRPPASAS